MAKTRATSAIIPSVSKLSRWQILRFAVAAGMVLAIVLIFRRVVPANATSVALIFLLAILYVSAFWGLRVSIFMSLLATLTFNYYFLPPLGALTIGRPSELGRARRLPDYGNHRQPPFRTSAPAGP